MTVGEPAAGARYLVAVAVHARRVLSGPREAFADDAAIASASTGGLLVRTCHRAELYIPATAVEPPIPEAPAGGEVLVDEAAVRHLFAVATGADSVVVAEDQILGQLREALREARARSRRPHLDPAIERLFQAGLAAGRRARAWRQTPPRSLADVALDRIEERTGDLHDRVIAVVGAGTMGRLAAMGARRRGATVIVTSRTAAHAAELARRVGGGTFRFRGRFPDEAVAAIVAVRGQWPLPPLPGSLRVLVDLSSPPALDGADAAVLGDRYVSSDDLARAPEAEPDRRLRHRLDLVIDEATEEYVQWVRGRQAVPTIQALREVAEERRATEVATLLRRLPGLEPSERALIEQMSERLVDGLLHEPLSRLRSDASGERTRAARSLFGL